MPLMNESGSVLSAFFTILNAAKDCLDVVR